MQYFFNLFLTLVLLGTISISHATTQLSLTDYLNSRRIPESRISIVKDILAKAPLKQSNWTVDPHLFLAIIEQESNYNPTIKAKYGSVGLMQIVPRWHRSMIKNRNPMDPHINTEIGIRVLYDCQQKYKTIPKALRCYNGGGTPGYSEQVIERWRRLRQIVVLDTLPIIFKEGISRE